MTDTKTLRIVESGVLIALATILSFIKVFEMPYGGSVTAFSLLPLVLLAYKYGVKWGMLCGLAYGLIQGVFGISSAAAGLEMHAVILVFILDYLVASCVLGFAAIFKGKLKNNTAGLVLGVVIVGVLKLFAHFLSGVIFFGQYAEWYFSQDGFTLGARILEKFNGTALVCIYSLFYNAVHVVPETIITCIAACVLISIPVVRKRII